MSGEQAAGPGAGASGAVTWRQLFADTKARVGDDAIARWLCEEASETDQLAAVMGEAANGAMVARLGDMVSRHLAGEPLAYVLGHWSFRHVELAVDPRVLIPRPETEVVAGVALELASTLVRPLTVVDLGTGSGAIGLALARELPNAGVSLWLTDVSSDAIAVARANLAGLGRDARNVRIAAGSWFDALPAGTVVDLAVANPPYIAAGSALVDQAVRDWEPHGALFAGPDGLDHIAAIVRAAPRWVRPGGWLVLEIGADQGDAVARLLRDARLAGIEVRPDLAGRDRVAVASIPANPSTLVDCEQTIAHNRPQFVTSAGSRGGGGGARRRQAKRTATSARMEPSSGVISSSMPAISRAAENRARRNTCDVILASMSSSRSPTVPSR